MKAAVFREYGQPDVIHLEEVAKPTPKESEVLIKVTAASINDWDWGILRGVPFVNRLTAGYPKPKKIVILGCDIAGVVEAVGSKVKQFKPGDAVFGDISASDFGGFAEFVCADEKALMPKPDSMTFEQAAALSQAGGLALQGLLQGEIYQGETQPRQKVLINGASGGTGSYAVQIAKSFGAEVTGVCRTSKMDMVRSIGADHVIDFTQEDYTQNGERYDLILDLMSYHSAFDSLRSLTPNGRYVIVGGASGRVMQVLFLSPWISLASRKKLSLLLLKPNKGLAQLIELFEAGNFVPVLDQSFPLSETAEAFRHFGEGRKKGKVVITIGRDGES